MQIKALLSASLAIGSVVAAPSHCAGPDYRDFAQLANYGPAVAHCRPYAHRNPNCPNVQTIRRTVFVTTTSREAVATSVVRVTNTITADGDGVVTETQTGPVATATATLTVPAVAKRDQYAAPYHKLMACKGKKIARACACVNPAPRRCPRQARRTTITVTRTRTSTRSFTSRRTRTIRTTVTAGATTTTVTAAPTTTTVTSTVTSSGAPNTCPTPQIQCAGNCVNPQVNVNFCGNCNTRCSTGQTCTAGVCTNSNPLTCPQGTECAAGSTCVVGVCVPSVLCGSIATPCPTGQLCVAGVCIPTGGLGATCTATANCDGALVCIAGICAAAGGLGATCSSTAVCNGALLCVAGVCVNAGGVGSRCGTTAACNGALLCVANICIGGPNGASCTANNECATGSSCQSGICTTKKGPLAACVVGTDCISGICNTVPIVGNRVCA